MNSYIEIKKEIERLEKSLLNKNNERKDLLLPLFKLIQDNSLNNVLPSNMDKCNPDNLSLRLTILAEEVMINELNDSSNIIKEIERIRREIINKNISQIYEEKNIKDLKVKLGERRKYVMSRIPELDNLNKEINVLQEGINRRLRILSEGTLEKEEKKIIRDMIDKNILKINKLEEQKSLIVGEEYLYKDMLVIMNEEGLEVTKKKEGNPFDKMMDLGKSLNEIEEKANNYEKKLNALVNERVNRENINTNSVNDVVSNNIVELKNEELPMEHNDIEINKPYDFTFEEVKEEDNSFDIEEVNANEELINEEIKNDELEVLETHSNFLLETKLKLKKGIRVILGLKNLMTKHLLSKKEKNNNNLDDEVILNEEVNLDNDFSNNEEVNNNKVSFEFESENISDRFNKSYDRQVVEEARDNIKLAKKVLIENADNLTDLDKQEINYNLSRMYFMLNKTLDDKDKNVELYHKDIEEIEKINNSLIDCIFAEDFTNVKVR